MDLGIYKEGRNREPSKIYSRLPLPDGRVLTITKIYSKNHAGLTKLDWELISSTFLDVNGNPFYDKNGIPFQGKKDNN